MKTKPTLLVTAALAGALGLTACSNGGDHSRDAAPSAREGGGGRSDSQYSEPSEKQPRVGMTRGQIRSMYGEPTNVRYTDAGEMWTYWFNRAHALIPYNFGYRPRIGTFIFDDRGVLQSYNYND